MHGKDGRGISRGRVGDHGIVGQGLEGDVALVACDEGEGGVADDLEKPGESVAAAEGVEIFESAHGGFLDYIVGVGIIAEDPVREVIRRIEVREYGIFEEPVLIRHTNP